MDIEQVAKHLSLLYIVGFAIQQALEVIGLALEKKALEKDIEVNTRRSAFRISAVILAFCSCLIENGLILKISTSGFINWFVSVMVISSGTEGTNSIVKFLAALKELTKERQAVAAEEKKKLQFTAPKIRLTTSADAQQENQTRVESPVPVRREANS
jgi:hypothetical protein